MQSQGDAQCIIEGGKKHPRFRPKSLFNSEDCYYRPGQIQIRQRSKQSRNQVYGLLYKGLVEHSRFDGVKKGHTRVGFPFMYGLIPNIPSPAPSSGIRTFNNALCHVTISDAEVISPILEYTDVIAYPLLLILCDALCNPGYVSYFLSTN